MELIFFKLISMYYHNKHFNNILSFPHILSSWIFQQVIWSFIAAFIPIIHAWSKNPSKYFQFNLLFQVMLLQQFLSVQLCLHLGCFQEILGEYWYLCTSNYFNSVVNAKKSHMTLFKFLKRLEKHLSVASIQHIRKQGLHCSVLFDMFIICLQ